MKATGIVRKIDELGRVVIPMEIRKSRGWEPGTPMEMFVTDEGLLIREHETDLEKAEIVKELNDILVSTNDQKISKAVKKAVEKLSK